jgi:hypothetical protein
MGGLGFKHRWKQKILNTIPDRPWGPRSVMYYREAYLISFPGVKRTALLLDHPPFV